MAVRAAPAAIETERLLLHQPSAPDAPEIFSRYASDADVTRYLSFRRHQSLADTHLFIDFSRMEWAANGCGPYLVRARDSGVLLGGTGLSLQGDEAEVAVFGEFERTREVLDGHACSCDRGPCRVHNGPRSRGARRPGFGLA